MSHFEKVSFERWKRDCGIKGLSDEELRKWYDAIKLPHQATAASAGCDFYMPFNLGFEAGSKFKIATGVRWVCGRDRQEDTGQEADRDRKEKAGQRTDQDRKEDAGQRTDQDRKEDAGRGTDRDKVLLIVPRSGLGFKYGIKLSNTVGVIDADYCDSDNEGHIIISLENPSDRNVPLKEGTPFAQGIVVRYEIPEGAASEASRNGGFGSTD